jgi:hypothetical protein
MKLRIPPFKANLKKRLLTTTWYGLPVTVLLGGVLPVQAQQTSFNCNSGKSYLFQNAVNSSVTNAYEIDLTTGTSVQKTTSGITGGQLNAFGFNPVDKYIWGQVYNQGQVVRIGSEFTAQTYTVSGLPSGPYVVGDIDKNGVMYLAIGGSNATTDIFTTDLTKFATGLSANKLTTTASFITDWAISPKDNNLYAMYSSLSNKPTALTLYRFLTADRTNANGTITVAGTRETLGEVSGGSPAITPNNFGSAFMDINGSFYVVANATGAVYRIDRPDLLAAGSSPTATYIASPSQTPNTTNTDGARCATSIVAPLPVTLVSFSAIAAPGRSVQLNWATASEQNNNYFEVQRSVDGQNFGTLKQVPGHHTTTQSSNYSFVDAAPGAAAIYYYRLRQVDLDGTSTYSPVRTVNLAAGSSPVQLAVVPNPTTATNLHVQVRYAGAAPASATLTVQTLLGQTLLAQSVTIQPGTNELIPTKILAPGAYWLSVRGDAALGTQGVRVLVSN